MNFKNKFYIMIFIGIIMILTGSCTTIGKGGHGHYNFTMTNFGIYTREIASERRDPSSPTGVVKTLSSYSFTDKTDKIPMKIGTSFGFEYRIESDGKGKSEQIEVLLIRYLPSKIAYSSKNEDSDYIVTTIYRKPDRTYLTGYTIENEKQMLPGTWRFIMMYHGEIVLKKEFTLVPEHNSDNENNENIQGDTDEVSGSTE